MRTKQCRTCKFVLPLDRFYPRKDAADGRRSSCINCAIIYNKRADIRKREAKRRQTKTYRVARKQSNKTYRAKPEVQSRIKLYGKRYNAVHTKEKQACKQLECALARGALTKPHKCDCCGRRRKLHGHHDDYSKPLSVRWLCCSCHQLLHKEAQNGSSNECT